MEAKEDSSVLSEHSDLFNKDNLANALAYLDQHRGGGGVNLDHDHVLSKHKSGEDPEKALGHMHHVFGQHRGVNMSIEASSAFNTGKPAPVDSLFDDELGPEGGYFVYSRIFNPTVMKLAAMVAAVEGTEAAYCTSSGISAISSVLLHLCDYGDHVVASRKLYGGTNKLLENFLPKKCNITTTFVDLNNLDSVLEVIYKKKPKLLYMEGVSNPTLFVANIPVLCQIAHHFGVQVVVDNTFTPMILSPARLGADIVVNSMTKYFSGGEDIIAGVVCGSKKLVNSMVDSDIGPLVLLGPTMNPKIAFDLSLRTPNLGMRVKEHSFRALKYAEYMKERGLNVIYPGLKDHKGHVLLSTIGNVDLYGYGGMVSVNMATEAEANKFMNLLQINKFGIIAVSLGYFDTLMTCSTSSTSPTPPTRAMIAIEQALVGIRAGTGLLRLSIGYSGTLQQRMHQLGNAIDQLQSSINS